MHARQHMRQMQAHMLVSLQHTAYVLVQHTVPRPRSGQLDIATGSRKLQQPDEII
jgi:hypothetical protein